MFRPRREITDEMFARCRPYLTLEHQEILALWYKNTMTYRQIAFALSLPDGTVRSRISRARVCIRKINDQLNDLENRSQKINEQLNEIERQHGV